MIAPNEAVKVYTMKRTSKSTKEVVKKFKFNVKNCY